MKNTIKTLAAILLTSSLTFAQESGQQELTEEQKKALIEFALNAQQKQKEKQKEEQERAAAIAAADAELEEKGKKWSELFPIQPDALTGKPQGFATTVVNQEVKSAVEEEWYMLRIDLTNEKVLEKIVILSGKHRFPFDTKNVRMVFHKGGDAVSVPVRRAETTDKALIIDNPIAVERVFDLLEAQGLCKMELKMSYKFDTITKVISFNTSNIPKEIVIER